MSQEPSTLREVAWRDILPGLSLISCLRLALSVRSLVLGALGIVATIAGWRICGQIFANTSDPELSGWIDRFGRWPWGERGQAMTTLLSPTMLGDPWVAWWHKSPVVVAWTELSLPFFRLFEPYRMTFPRGTYLLLCGLWALLVWALLGGAITRLAAVALARDEHVPWGNALAYARSKFLSYFAAPLFPLLGALVAALCIALVGLLLRFDVGALIAAVLWPLVLLGGLLMAVLLVGLMFGWPLMWATISVEGTDSFDALSRSYAYTYQRPLHYLFYATLAIFLGSLGWLLVWIFATAVNNLSLWAVALGSDTGNLRDVLTPREDATSALRAASALVHFWMCCLVVLALGFIYSYFWTAATAIYFLLRKHVDATETDEVFIPEEEETYGMPPLRTDAAGVPGVVDEPSVTGLDRGTDGAGAHA